RRLFDAFMQYSCLVLYNDRGIAERLNTSTWFALNVKRQVLKLIRKGERRDYFSLVKPSFSGGLVITSADDSLEKGQFKKLRIEGNKLIFELKVPVGNAWEWIKVEKFVPDRLRKALKNAKEIKAPLIKKVDLKSGFSIYRLVIPLEIQTKVKDKVERVFALDLSPSEKRIGVGVVVDSEGYSKPVFFNAYKMVKKLERLYREISNLEKKIDHIADDLHSTFKREHKEKLYQRLRHLYQEQKLRWRKFKDLRKQVLESFTNLVILHAKAYNCDAIAIEDLKFKD
ncbi:MAG: RNA-guided endonuclease TnpB family protein, partial [Candidatus Aenigmatarchaeota archaeon]